MCVLMHSVSINVCACVNPAVQKGGIDVLASQIYIYHFLLQSQCYPAAIQLQLVANNTKVRSVSESVFFLHEVAVMRVGVGLSELLQWRWSIFCGVLSEYLIFAVFVDRAGAQQGVRFWPILAPFSLPKIVRDNFYFLDAKKTTDFNAFFFQLIALGIFAPLSIRYDRLSYNSVGGVKP